MIRHPWLRKIIGLPILLALIAPLLSSVARGQAEVYLEVRKSDIFRIPVVVEDFQFQEPAVVRFSGGGTIEGVLTRDLVFSDAITVIRLAAEAPVPTGLLLDVRGMPVDRRVQARVRARVRPREDKIEIDAQLLDEGSGKEIFSRTYDLPWEPPTGMADTWGLHRLSDDIIFFLTGTRGCAASRIAFVRAGPSGKEINLIDWDGLHEEPLTALGAIAVSPGWHPNGSRLAFTSYHRGEPLLAAIEPGRGRLQVLTAERTPAGVAYSPDGKRIAFSTTRDGNAEIYVAHADGSRLRRLTVHPAIDTAPSWSPSGMRLVFTSDRAGNPQLFVIDADGGNLEQITFTGDWNDSPDWSPRADRIVHVCRYDTGFDLALINADGSSWRRLTVGGGCENPRWAPDGRHVVFARLRGGGRNLWILGVDAGSLRQLTASQSDSYNPAWSRPSKERLRAASQGG